MDMDRLQPDIKTKDYNGGGQQRDEIPKRTKEMKEKREHHTFAEEDDSFCALVTCLINLTSFGLSKNRTRKRSYAF